MYTVPSIDGHWFHDSIFKLTKVITQIMLILDVQFIFLPVGVKWKFVIGVHFPTLLNGSGLMSISSC